jgi:hypothetical protein
MILLKMFEDSELGEDSSSGGRSHCRKDELGEDNSSGGRSHCREDELG